MNLLSYSKQFLNRNASTILTCIGGAGVVVTSVLAAKATPKALTLLEETKKEKGEDLTKLEVVKTAGPAYIPAILVGASTIACIFGANVLNKRKQAAIMSAYALIDNSYKEYKKKIIELYGEDANDKITEEFVKEKYEEYETPVSEDKKLFYDEYSGRMFESTIKDVQNAEYQINRDLSMRDYATVNEFYEYLKLEPIEGGDEIGWSTGMNFDYYWQSWIDFGHKKVLIDDDLECIAITMFGEPTIGWENYA